MLDWRDTVLDAFGVVEKAEFGQIIKDAFDEAGIAGDTLEEQIKLLPEGLRVAFRKAVQSGDLEGLKDVLAEIGVNADAIREKVAQGLPVTSPIEQAFLDIDGVLGDVTTNLDTAISGASVVGTHPRERRHRRRRRGRRCRRLCDPPARHQHQRRRIGARWRRTVRRSDPVTISGTYNPTNNSVALTVTGGPSGTLVVYKQSTSEADDDSPRVVIVDTVPGYTGGTSVTDWLPENKSLTYHAYVDDVPNGSTVVDVPASGFTGVWMMSLTDPTRRTQVKVARERRDSWRARERRGWTGDVIGETRTVGVTDVAMSGRRGRFDVITEHGHRARPGRPDPARRHRVRQGVQRRPATRPGIC